MKLIHPKGCLSGNLSPASFFFAGRNLKTSKLKFKCKIVEARRRSRRGFYGDKMNAPSDTGEKKNNKFEGKR